MPDRIYRAFPWLRGARRGASGHPMFVRRDAQGSGRLDNPELYPMLYAAGDGAAAIAEVFQRRPVWRPSMFARTGVPNATWAIATLLRHGTQPLNLDEPANLAERGLRPSRVASTDRAVTQGWARTIFDEGTWDGASWWSSIEPSWTLVGLWEFGSVRPSKIEPLTIAHPAVQEAADVLGRRIVG